MMEHWKKGYRMAHGREPEEIARNQAAAVQIPGPLTGDHYFLKAIFRRSGTGIRPTFPLSPRFYLW
jgi:hypothetical protein